MEAGTSFSDFFISYTFKDEYYDCLTSDATMLKVLHFTVDPSNICMLPVTYPDIALDLHTLTPPVRN